MKGHTLVTRIRFIAIMAITTAPAAASHIILILAV